MLLHADWTRGQMQLWDSGDKVYRNVIQWEVLSIKFILLRPEFVLFLPTE